MVFSRLDCSLACSFSILNAMAYSRISANTPCSPLCRSRRKCRSSFSTPKAPSDWILRLIRSRMPFSLPRGRAGCLKRPTDLDRSVSFCLGTVFLVWAACAAFRLIHADLLLKSAFCFPLSAAAEAQFFPRRTGKAVFLFVIRHVFPQIGVPAEAPLFVPPCRCTFPLSHSRSRSLRPDV